MHVLCLGSARFNGLPQPLSRVPCRPSKWPSNACVTSGIGRAMCCLVLCLTKSRARAISRRLAAAHLSLQALAMSDQADQSRDGEIHRLCNRDKQRVTSSWPVPASQDRARRVFGRPPHIPWLAAVVGVVTHGFIGLSCSSSRSGTLRCGLALALAPRLVRKSTRLDNRR